MPRAKRKEPVALVLAGGGARGAYEAGALSVLLPVLEERGQRPRILVGTSVGAVNVAYLGANAQLTTDELISGWLANWESISWGEIARRLLSLSTLRRLVDYAGEVLGVPGARIASLLDPAPLRAMLAQRLDCGQLTANVAAGRLDSVAVVATSMATGRSVVFHDGLPSPPDDRLRRIDYVATALREDQVVASAAIPGIFPAARVGAPPAAAGWYIDGGTRLNTPIKPALSLGATRVVVVALNSPAPGPMQAAGARRPDALQDAGQILLGLLTDQLTADLQTLVTINGLVAAAGQPVLAAKRRIPYVLIAPAATDAIADCALRVVREHYSGTAATLRSPDIALLSRLVAGGADASHAELLSFLLFAPEFARALIELGQADARRWLDAAHDLDDVWQVGPLSIA